MEYDNFKQLFSLICEIKEFVVKLNSKDLRSYKRTFYNQVFFRNANFNQSMLDRMWEYIFDDISYEELKTIFENNNLI